MTAFRQLNRQQGMTVLVVTHNPTVARATDRIVVLRDGQIVRDEPVRDLYRQDLREFKASALGQALLEGEVPQAMQGLGLETLLPGLQRVLGSA